MVKKIGKGMLWFMLITFIIMGVGLECYAPKAIMKPPRRPSGNHFSKAEKMDFKTHDQFLLKAYRFPSALDTTYATLITHHGIGANKDQFAYRSGWLTALGLEVIVYDARAHGESEGTYCTYGFHEKKDVSSLIDMVLNENPERRIGIWGYSMGGAVAIQAMEIDKRIAFGVIESTFTDLYQIVFDYQKRITGIGWKGLSNHIINRSARAGKYSPQKVKPIESVRNIEQPVFVAHGGADRNIKPEYGRALFEAFKSKEKEFYLVEGAGHKNICYGGRDEYRSKVVAFLKKWRTAPSKKENPILNE